VLGIAQVDAAEWAKLGSAAPGTGGTPLTGHAPGVAVAMTDAEIGRRIAERLAARKAKNWAESDRIRDELAKAGIILEDRPGGTTSWRRA
jgi:cysteinyl-tRNA synthetase